MLAGSGVSLFAYAVLVLAWNLGTVLWGAYVRATGSGAGCGAHWPLCNGEVLPRSPAVETLIELTHRLTSGVALLLVAGLVLWVFRVRPHGDRVRFWAAASGVLILTEALLGAGLVLFELVADDDSSARAFAMVAHLINTFALLGAIALAVRWTAAPPGPARERLRVPPLVVAAGLAVVAIAATGAIAALGDTLFPARSLGEGLRQDFSPTSHLLLRLRILHPVLGVLLGAFTALVALLCAARGGSRAVGRLGVAVAGLVVLQLVCGFANWILLAPVWLQLVHLLLADGLWITLVLLGSATAEATAVPAAARTEPAPALAAARER